MNVIMKKILQILTTALIFIFLNLWLAYTCNSFFSIFTILPSTIILFFVLIHGKVKFSSNEYVGDVARTFATSLILSILLSLVTIFVSGQISVLLMTSLAKTCPMISW